MACLSSKFIHVILACLLLLLSEIHCEDTCEMLEDTSKHMVYAASENEDIKLVCDVSGTLASDEEAPFFWGRYHPEASAYNAFGEIDFSKDRDKYDYSVIGDNGAELVIKNFNTATDSTMWCCFVPVKRFVSIPKANYAVLYIQDENVPITMTPPESTIFQLGDQVSVKCAQSASMLDKIQPSIFWTSPNRASFDFGLDGTADTISLTVSKEMNGMEIQCGNSYERSNMGGKPLELKSRVITLKVAFPTEFDEDSSTPNEDPITVELGKPTKLECAFSGNPPVHPSSEISWTRISVTPPAQEDDASTPNQIAADNSCPASLSEGAVPLSQSDKFTLGSEVTDGVTYFSLTINDFSKGDLGCYVCSLQVGQQTLERPFNVIDSSSMKQTGSATSPQVSIVSLITMLFLYPLLATIIFSPSASV